MWEQTLEQKQNSNNIENAYFSNDCSNNNNFQIKLGFDPEEMKKINFGEVQTELIYKEKVYIFYFDSINNKENDLLIHFYPLDCNIKIIPKNENDNNYLRIEPISNYEYNAFYTIINKDKLNSTYFKIKVLMNSKNDYNKNRTYHLIINSFEYINNSNLIIKEKEPTLLNFNNTIEKFDKINLLYNLNNKENYIHPISISFFIKERVKFEITISNNKEESFKKIIAYTDRILIDTNFFQNSSFINIYLEKIEKKKDAVLIAKVIGDYSTPIYFQKNILNIGFIPSGTSYQYYYLEVFKGEEGGITLNNKKYKGILISKIVERGEIECNIFNSSECYPTEDDRNISLFNIDYLPYDEFSQNLTLNVNHTNKCEDGCYLLITYYSIYFSDKKSNNNIIGTEFTLLIILLEENDITSQIVNIPLNEHIFGIIDYSSHNIHYYSIFLPEKTNYTKFDLDLYNTRFYFYEGIEKFNIYRSDHFNKTLGDFTKNGANLIGGQYFTFAINTYGYRDSHYYKFKIFQLNSTNNISIYQLDTNKETNCETMQINDTYSCFLFIDNIYKDFYNDIIIYAYGNKKVKYTTWFGDNNENNIYSMDIEDLNGMNNIDSNTTYLKIDKEKYFNSKYILIQIKYNQEEKLTILTNFYDHIYFSPSFHLFSYQLIYLPYNETFTFNFDYSLHNQYRILINNTFGNGRMCFNKNCSQNYSMISGKRIFSFIINNETQNSYKIKNINDDVLFNIKIDYDFFNEVFEELRYNTDSSKYHDKFPIGFILNDIYNNGADINFYFYSNESIMNFSDIKIQGNIIDYDKVRQRNILNEPYNLKIDGRFDNRTNIGLIVFEKELIERVLISSSSYYYIKIISEKKFYLEIHAISKDDSNYLSIPFNKYISGKFRLTNQSQSQKYYFNFINDTQISDENFIIEFSSNYKNINLTFGNNITKYNYSINDEIIQKYLIKFNYNEDSENYFIVQLNNNDSNSTTGDNMENANYILKFYPQYYEENIKNIFNLTHNNKDDSILKKSGNSTYIFKCRINYNNIKIDHYEFTYILNIYEKEKIFQNELINTIATIESKAIYSNITFFNNSIDNLTYYLDFLEYKVLYEASIFVIIQNKEIKEKKNYYSYIFEIEKKNDDESHALMKVLIILSIIIIISIPVLIFIIKYRNIMKKNLELEEKVKTISFSGESEGYEDSENKRDPQVSFI